MTRLLVELALGAVLLGGTWAWWEHHNGELIKQGEARCQAAVGAATAEGRRLAQVDYDRQVKEKDDVIQQAQKDQAVSDAAFNITIGRLRDYENSLHARAVRPAPDASGVPGPEVVRFTFEDYRRFAEACMTEAKNGQDDALALKECKAYSLAVQLPSHP